MTEFTLQILFIFTPGLLGLILIRALTSLKDMTPFFFSVYSFLIGLLSYLCVFLTYALVNSALNVGLKFDFINSIFVADKLYADEKEIILACLASIFISLIVSLLINYKLLTRFAHSARITNKFGDKDVWDYVFNSSTPTEWIAIRNSENDLAYTGWVETYSDTHQESELFIRNVNVFRDSDGEFLYSRPGLYLTFEPQSINIEFLALDYVDEIAGGAQLPPIAPNSTT